MYLLDNDDLRASIYVPSRNLISTLSEQLRAHDHPEGWGDDVTAVIDRGYRGWPFQQSITHPLFGSVGVSDEFELAEVAGAMRYLLTTGEPDSFLPHAELPKVDVSGHTVAI